MFTTLPTVAPSRRPGIATRPSPGSVRVAVVGEIDLSNSDLLRIRLLNVLSASHPHHLDVDLAGVPFLDCSGITVLVAVDRAAARIGCRLHITNPQPLVRRVLDLTGLLDVLTAGFDEAPLPAATADVTVSVDLLVPLNRRYPATAP
jgi:anti-anti-sigma factor